MTTAGPERRATARAFVVDASVAVKWLVAEEHTVLAQRLLELGLPMHVPDHFSAEVGNALHQKFRRGQATAEIVDEAIEKLTGLPLVVHRGTDLLAAAVDLAREHQRSIYDALYLALALQLRIPLVTADRRLYEAIAAPMPFAVTWIEDLPAA